MEVLDHWLRSCDCERRSWRDVERALRQLECHQFAKEIESINKTGHDSAIITQYYTDIYIYFPGGVLQQSESDQVDDVSLSEDFQPGFEDVIKYAIDNYLSLQVCNC